MVERVPEEKINEIRHAVDIIDVISEHVHLKKQGRNFVGLCPFHGEKTPSFSVSPEKQIFHCFGCGAGGNVFSFVMDMEGISFQEALMKLAKRGNVPLEINTADVSRTISNEQEKMIEAHELLKELYHHLLVHTNEGEQALHYLLQRGFTKEVIEHFQIGYALDKWDFSLNFLKSRGFEESLLEKAGLLIRKENEDGYYDRFRNRIIFPIFDNKGKTVAFSGRVLYEGQPKYLNSPETAIFHKSRILYNFHEARVSIRKNQQVVLFEGFADCISAYGAGIENGIATMGTALSEEHIHLIRRSSERVILCFDSDAAGQTATLKAGEMLQEAGCKVQVAMFHSAKDPDDYIKKFGSEKFKKEVIESSITFMAFKMKFFRQGKNLQNEGERSQYIEQVLVEVSKLDNAIERDVYLRQLAEEFSLSLDALKQQQRKIFYEQRKGNRNQHSKSTRNVTSIKQDKKLPNAYHNAERMLIAHMLKDVQLAFVMQEKMKDFSFNDDDHQAIAMYLFAFYEEGNEPDLSNFLTFMNDKDLSKKTTEIAMIPINKEITDKELSDYIYHVLKRQKELKIVEMQNEIKKAGQQDWELAAQKLQDSINLLKKL